MLLSASGAVVFMLVSVHAGHTSSINSDNVEPICRGINCFLKSVKFQYRLTVSHADIVLQIINSSVM